jgi:hypothetical protein
MLVSVVPATMGKPEQYGPLLMCSTWAEASAGRRVVK